MKESPDPFIEKVGKCLMGQRWVFAKSYAKTAPHEWTQISDWQDLEGLTRRDVFEALGTHTTPLSFGRSSRFRYLIYGKYKFWRMTDDLSKSRIFNRALLSDEDIAQLSNV